jgi:hypothetical protein
MKHFVAMKQTFAAQARIVATSYSSLHSKTHTTLHHLEKTCVVSQITNLNFNHLPSFEGTNVA